MPVDILRSWLIRYPSISSLSLFFSSPVCSIHLSSLLHVEDPIDGRMTNNDGIRWICSYIQYLIIIKLSFLICTIYKYTYIFTHIFTYIHTYIYIFTHMQLHVHIQIYIHIHTYTHTHIHTYTHTHIHTYIHTAPDNYLEHRFGNFSVGTRPLLRTFSANRGRMF